MALAKYLVVVLLSALIVFLVFVFVVAYSVDEDSLGFSIVAVRLATVICHPDLRMLKTGWPDT